MNYTQDQLAALADKGAEAANRVADPWMTGQTARIAFARAVLDGAAEMKPKAVSEKESREAFEADCRAKGVTALEHGTWGNNYLAEHVQTAWLGWQAALAYASRSVGSADSSEPQPTTPTPPEGFRLATEEEVYKLPEGSVFWRMHGGEAWEKSHSVGISAATDLHFYACPNEPEWIPLDAGDVPPGSAIRMPDRNRKWAQIVAVYPDVVVLPAQEQITFSELTDRYEISRDNGKTWQPCKKPCTPPRNPYD